MAAYMATLVFTKTLIKNVNSSVLRRSVRFSSALLNRQDAVSLSQRGYNGVGVDARPRKVIGESKVWQPMRTRRFSSTAHAEEKTVGPEDTHEFQAETRMLLEIVAKSLYSEKEIFIRELISNSSDALERFRFLLLTDGEKVDERDRLLQIDIFTDNFNKTFSIQDNGVGMTKEGLVKNLGVIARSGSKEFLKHLEANKGEAMTNAPNIIGQFGVGFYSAFVVADKVQVFTKSCEPGSVGYMWESDGSGTFKVSEAENVKPGTKIVLHLKDDCKEFADEAVIKRVIEKYSSFVGSPILLNTVQANKIQALWLMDPKDVTDEMHTEFYRFVGNTYDQPRYRLQYKIDAPLNIRCLLYVPEGKPGLFEMSREMESGVALYCRKILIKNKADNLLPKWLRFVKGVVDSEDIPLNLSRELLQDSALIRKLRTVLTNRLIRYLVDQSRKDPEKYTLFYRDYGLFLKEGIVMGSEQVEKEEIAKLLRFESSAKPAGEKVSFPEYLSRLKEGQNDIYYLAAPSRNLAELSPYYEALKRKEVEVLFCYEPYDELVLLHLREFDRKLLTSVEKEMRRDKDESSETNDVVEGALSAHDSNDLIDWLKRTLGAKVHLVKETKRLSTHPCVVTVEEMGAARHFLRTQFQSISDEQRYKMLQPILEINTGHPILLKLSELKNSNPRFATLVAEQLFDNAMMTAGLIEDPRTLLLRMNELLTLALEKH